MNKIIAIDIETKYGNNRACDPGFYLTCVGVEDHTGKQTVFWFDHSQVEDVDWQNNLSALRNLIENADIIIAHNLKYDMTVLRNYNISFEKQELWCTMVTEYLLSGQAKEVSVSLDAVADHYGLGRKMDKVKGFWKDGIETYDIPKELIDEYVRHDCHLTMEIYKKQKAHEEMKLISKIHKLQMEFQLALSDMELFGFRFDTDKAMAIIKEYDEEMLLIEYDIKDMIGNDYINIGSNQQKSAILFGGLLRTSHPEWVIQTLKTKPESLYKERSIEEEELIEGLGFTPPKTKNKDGYYPVGKEIIKGLVAKTPDQKRIKTMLMEYSVIKKARETLLGKDDKGLMNKIGTDGNIHPDFNMAVTVTGRLSSSNPNGQNLPRGSTSPLKKCIVPCLDGILQGDLSQIEWRAAAELSQDEMMIKEINEGIDQHSAACVDIMKLKLTKDNRNFAKIFNFRAIFGGSGYGYYMDGKMPSFTLAKWNQIVDDFNDKYYQLVMWQDRNIAEVNRTGQLRSPTGRKFMFRKDENFEYPERPIKNYPVQGTAGDILSMVVVILRRAMRRDNMMSRMILTVHDSVVIDYKEEEKDKIIEYMNFIFNNLDKYIKGYFEIPWRTNLTGEIEVGPNYGELKEVKI